MPRPNHVYEIYIRTTPERLWQALTDPDLTRRYYYGSRFEAAEVATGQAYAYRHEDGVAAIEGTITEAEPFRRLVTTFQAKWSPELAAEPPSRVTWEITPLGEVCLLRLVHDDLHGSPATYAETGGGWPWIIGNLKSVLETGEALPPRTQVEAGNDDRTEVADLERDHHRDDALETNHLVWNLLGQEVRSPAEDEQLVHAAHASAYHWDIAGTDLHRARAAWLCSHVYAVLGRPEPALHHAERCLALTRQADAADFDLAYANEAMARALAAAGRLDDAAPHLEAARQVPIGDDQDREIFLSDLMAGPWYGLAVDAPAPA
jgi:uncharacterized protein YndB with AHSA1/START domain